MAKNLPKGITKRPDGRYMGRFTYCGERYTLYNKDLKKLEKQINDMRYELEHGIVGDMSKITVKKWFEVWLKESKESVVKESTMEHFKTFYFCYIDKELGKRDIHNVRLIHVQRLYNDMARNGYKENTIKKVNNILHNMFQYAVRNELISKNPCTGILIPKTEKKERRTLTQQEQNDFLKFVREDNHYRIYNALFVTGFGTGARIGELLALSWDDIDYVNKVIHIRKTLVYLPEGEGNTMRFKIQTPKTSKSERDIPLLANVESVLKSHRLEQKKHILYMGDKWQPLEEREFKNLVFTTEFGRPLDRNMINRTIHQIVAKMNKSREQPLEDFTPHTMRHSFATRCFENGIPAKVVQEVLGHTSLNMTMDLYTHVVDETKQEEMRKMDYMFKQA